MCVRVSLALPVALASRRCRPKRGAWASRLLRHLWYSNLACGIKKGSGWPSLPTAAASISGSGCRAETGIVQPMESLKQAVGETAHGQADAARGGHWRSSRPWIDQTTSRRTGRRA